MRMQFAPLCLVKVLLCLQFVCQCNGAPPIKDDRPFNFAAVRYTDQEFEFIKNVLRNLPSDYMNASEKTIWKEIEERMQELRRSGTEGFPQDRTDAAIRKFFKRNLSKNEEFMAELPETVRQQLRDLMPSKRHGGSQPYTYEEDKFIVDALLKYDGPYIPIRGFSVWEPIAAELNKKRGSPGFYAERTAYGLRDHFKRSTLVNPSTSIKVPVPKALIQKFCTAFREQRLGDGDSSSHLASQSQQTDLRSELDFSKLDLPASSSLSHPDDLGSDLEYLEDFEDFWDFEDFEE